MPERPEAYAPADEHDIEQIGQLVAELEAGQNQNDVDLLDRRFTSDALWVTASGTRLLGWDEMNAHHRIALADAPEGLRVRFSILRLHFLSEDVAVAHTRQDYLSPETGTNHGTAVLTKKNGTWWICAMQHTNVASRRSRGTARASDGPSA